MILSAGNPSKTKKDKKKKKVVKLTLEEEEAKKRDEVCNFMIPSQFSVLSLVFRATKALKILNLI